MLSHFHSSPALFPVSIAHGLRGSHHVLPHALWGANQGLSLRVLELMMEGLGDHATAGIKLMGGHVGDLNEHCRHQVHTLQHLWGGR